MVLSGLHLDVVVVIVLAIGLVIAGYTALCLMVSRKQNQTGNLGYRQQQSRRPY